MAITVTAVELIPEGGDNLRAWDIVMEKTDTTTGARAHGLPFTPSLAYFYEKTAAGTFPALAVTTTATTWTVTKQDEPGGDEGCTIRLYVGRWPNPQDRR